MTLPYKPKNSHRRGRNARAKNRADAVHGSIFAAELQKMPLDPPPPKLRIRPSRPIKGKTPIQTLPYETLVQIFSYLRDDPTPAIEILSRVCRRFRTIVKTAPSLHSDITRKTLSKQLFCAELLHPYLFPTHHLACYGCNKVFDSGRHKFKFSRSDNRNGKGLGGIRAKSRQCIECHYKDFNRCRFLGDFWSGDEVRECTLCGNWVITPPGVAGISSCADHADWKTQFLREAPSILDLAPPILGLLALEAPHLDILAYMRPTQVICSVIRDLIEEQGRHKAVRDKLSARDTTRTKASLRKQNREKIAADLDTILAQGFAKVFDHDWLEARDWGWELWDLSNWQSLPVVQDW